MSNHPLVEVFGFPVDNFSVEAVDSRGRKLCPFKGEGGLCHKDKEEAPLGVCSMSRGDKIVIICPNRFLEGKRFLDDAAEFLFPSGQPWTYFTEVKIKDKNGKEVGRSDLVLVSLKDKDQLDNFGSVEVQAVYISGNIREPFTYYTEDPSERFEMDWKQIAKKVKKIYPRPDYLSARKRLAFQLRSKGSIFHSWNKKQVVIVDSNFYSSLPEMDEVERDEAEIAWMIYDVRLDQRLKRYRLVRTGVKYTAFESALEKIMVGENPDSRLFEEQLGAKLLDQIKERNRGDRSDVSIQLDLLTSGGE